jgi:putative ABC transport system permease protein
MCGHYNSEMFHRRLPAALIAAAACAAAVRASAVDPIPSVLVSRQLFISEKLSVGDVVTLAADRAGANRRKFRVAGSYEPVPDPMRLGAVRNEVRMHLPDLIDMTADPRDPMSSETVDALNIAITKDTKGGYAPKGQDTKGRAKDEHTVEAFAQDLATRLPGLIVRPTAAGDDRAAPFIVLERFHLAIAIVTVIASSIFLLALMLMLVDERRSTVGILRLIGYRRRRILIYVFIEGLIVAAAGAAIGIVIAAAFQGGVNQFFQWRYDTVLVFVRITPTIALRSISMAVPLGVLAAVASSWTLLRRDVFALTRR